MKIESLIRKNIAELAPYSTARDEYSGEIGVYLDANENPNNNGYNRYPDPYQAELKKRIAELKGVSPNQLFLGNGSDEAIDLVYRIFCEPNLHNAISIEPSYGMYKVAANINNVAFNTVKLDNDFNLNADKILDACNTNTRIIFLCSPNNPSGNLLNPNEIIKIIENFAGIVVIDEAYIDFADSPSFISSLPKYPNLVILQTLSKAWGLAGLRLGLAIASSQIIDVFTKVKYPYNINISTQSICIEQLQYPDKIYEQINSIKNERKWLIAELQPLLFVEKVYPSQANFILVKVTDANKIYDYLIRNKIIVRNRHNVTLCNNCLRITVGTTEENQNLVATLKEFTT